MSPKVFKKNLSEAFLTICILVVLFVVMFLVFNSLEDMMPSYDTVVYFCGEKRMDALNGKMIGNSEEISGAWFECLDQHGEEHSYRINLSEYERIKIKRSWW